MHTLWEASTVHPKELMNPGCHSCLAVMPIIFIFSTIIECNHVNTLVCLFVLKLEMLTSLVVIATCELQHAVFMLTVNFLFYSIHRISLATNLVKLKKSYETGRGTESLLSLFHGRDFPRSCNEQNEIANMSNYTIQKSA